MPGKSGLFKPGAVVAVAAESSGRRGGAGCQSAMGTGHWGLAIIKTPQESPALKSAD